MNTMQNPTETGIQMQPVQTGTFPMQNAALQMGKVRFIFTPLLLSLITFGIYGLVWLYKIHDEMLLHTRDLSIKPGAAVGFLFIPFFNVFWAIYLIFHVPSLVKKMDMADNVAVSEQTNPALIGILGLVPVVNIFWSAMVQNALNRHWKRHGVGN